MSRRYYGRPAPRRRSYDDDYYSYHSRKRGGCLAPVRRFFRQAMILLLVAIGAIILFLIILLIAFNFTVFVQILFYALFVIAGLAVLGLLYLVIRMITAISGRISAASVARSKARIERERARIERERVEQARVQIRAQEAKLYREERLFNQKYVREAERDYYESPRRTRNFREESPYRTRVLAQQLREPDPLPEQDPEPEEIETELEAVGMPTKGQVFHYRSYKKLLRPGQLIVGIRKDRSARTGSWQEFKILLILGASSSGKSTTVLEKCLCIVNDGGQLIICDPGGFKPDSLIQRLGSLAHFLLPGTILAIEHEEIMQNAQRFLEELECRRRGADMSVPILLVIDELNGLLMDKEIKKELTELIEKFAQQARGYNMYMVLCAQRASGLASIRNSVISFVVHKCPEMEAGKLLPARYAKLAPQLGVGQTFVSDADGFIDPLQQTLISKQDIEERLAQRRTTRPTTTNFYNSETKPVVPPRQFGAPSRKLHRTNLVSEEQPTQEYPGVPSPATTPKTPRRQTVQTRSQTRPISPPRPPTRSIAPTTPTRPGASATWGETQPISSEARPLIAPRMTEELAPRSPLPSPQRPPALDDFDLLAERRAKRKQS